MNARTAVGASTFPEDTVGRVLVTGATGTLGREIVPALLRAGHTVRATSRRPRVGGSSGGVEWTVVDLSTGAGLAEAVDGVDVVVHAATSPMRRTRRIDLLGTERLLRESEKAAVTHVVYPSIIGIDSVPFPYYRHKLSAERAVAESGLPYSILRATKFHPFIDTLLSAANRLPFMILPTDFVDQPIDPREVARRLVRRLSAGPGGRLPDLAGPEVLTFGAMAERWLIVRGSNKRLLRLPVPGRAAERFREGATTDTQAERGVTTWAEWLEKTSGS